MCKYSLWEIKTCFFFCFTPVPNLHILGYNIGYITLIVLTSLPMSLWFKHSKSELLKRGISHWQWLPQSARCRCQNLMDKLSLNLEKPEALTAHFHTEATYIKLILTTFTKDKHPENRFSSDCVNPMYHLILILQFFTLLKHKVS